MNNPFEIIDRRLSNIEALLLDFHHRPKTLPVSQEDSEELLTIQQASKLLSLAVPTIYGLVSKSEIPFCKKGKRLYFSKPELTDWVRSGRNKTITEIQAEAVAGLAAAGRRTR